MAKKTTKKSSRRPRTPVTIRKRYDTRKILSFFGEVVEWRRTDLGMSRHELGELCGCGYSFIWRIERGGRVTLPRVNEFNRLAKVLGLSVEEMLQAAGYVPIEGHADILSKVVNSYKIFGDKKDHGVKIYA
jgi:transcriptional regulator with XRE-family HTH domain